MAKQRANGEGSIHQTISLALKLAVDQWLAARNAAENEKRLPHPAAVGGRSRRAKRAETEAMGPPVGVPIIHRRLDTYAHVTTSAKREAANTMGNVLSCTIV